MKNLELTSKDIEAVLDINKWRTVHRREVGYYLYCEIATNIHFLVNEKFAMKNDRNFYSNEKLLKMGLKFSDEKEVIDSSIYYHEDKVKALESLSIILNTFNCSV